MRYFFERKRMGIISFINFVSVLGVALGVASLIIVLSIMNGFDSEVREKIIGIYAHLTVMKPSGIEDPGALSAMIKSLPYVENAAGFVAGQAILRQKKQMTGVLLKGIDPREESKVTDILSFIDCDPGELKDDNVILGREIMRNYGISAGDTVELVVPYSSLDLEKKKFTVAGAFRSGRYDYDANTAIMGIDGARKLYRMSGMASGIAIRVKEGEDVGKVKALIGDFLGGEYDVRSWMDLDSNLVAALALEKKMMFIILGVIILVACFNISSSLFMMVMEKTRDIGILKAVGANAWGVSSVFLLEGFFIGALGVTAGSMGGVFIAERVNPILSAIRDFTGMELFPSDVYYFSEIPVRINPGDVFAITVFSLVLALFAGIYPALKASRLDPVEAIRYE